VSGLTVTEATLNANLTNTGTASTLTTGFEYGLTTAYGSMVAGAPPTLTTAGAFTASLTGLTPNTLYHYRAEAVGGSTVYGNDQTFTTLASPWASNGPFTNRVGFRLDADFRQ
jgi:phosphodiesterase/alkaline phosphatase D-like protein